MKASSCTHAHWMPLAVAATLMGTLAVSAQEWQTVDDFAFAVGDAEARGVAVDGAGGIYVVGTASGHVSSGIALMAARIGTCWMSIFTRWKPTASFTPSPSIMKEVYSLAEPVVDTG
jgi:hypothetical protein